MIWGDNKLVLSSLKNGPLRREIEVAGGLKLIYIDPPFDVGADFSFSVDVGDETLTKQPSLIEELAYRDTWGKSGERYVQYMFERLRLSHELMADDASIYVHCDWRVSPYLRLLLDEILGREFAQNQITWKRIYSHSDANRFGIVDDTLLFYSKSDRFRFNKQYRDHSESYIKSHYGQTDSDGRAFRLVTLSGAGPGPARRFGEKVILPPKGRHWHGLRNE